MNDKPKETAMGDQPIDGYRALNQAEVDLINEIKAHGSALGALVEKLRARGQHLDQRWVSEGNTDLQKGLMCLTRAVAQPTNF